MIRTFSSKELEAKINGKINLKSVILKGFGYKHYRLFQLLNLKISENMRLKYIMIYKEIISFKFSL